MTDEKCFFTGLDTNHYSAGRYIQYYINIDGEEILIMLSHDSKNWSSNRFYQQNQHIFRSLLLNGDWMEISKQRETVITLDVLEQLLKEKDYPKTPNQKLENLFLMLYNMQNHVGERINVNLFLEKNSLLWKKAYFRNTEECAKFFDFLLFKNYIEAINLDNRVPYIFKAVTDFPQIVTITFEGLNYAVKLTEEGEKSNKCFIAMAFDDSTVEIRKAIKEALGETNFEPYIVDEKHFESDRTINDEIIAGLKKCRFCISDFTMQKRGVYFEAGFALGQGKKVIYTCAEADFGETHFDTKSFQQLIYKTPEELKKRLVDKIEAWVK